MIPIMMIMIITITTITMIIITMMIPMIDYQDSLKIQQKSYNMVMVKSKKDYHGLTNLRNHYYRKSKNKMKALEYAQKTNQLVI